MLLFTKHVCCRYWRSWYYHKNNALLRILCCVVQFRQFGSGSVVPTTCLSSFCITGMKMLKPTTNRKKHPFISAWPWTIQAFVLGTLQGLATRNGCTNMHANVAHHEQLLQALNDTWKGFFCMFLVPVPWGAGNDTCFCFVQLNLQRHLMLCHTQGGGANKVHVNLRTYLTPRHG